MVCAAGGFNFDKVIYLMESRVSETVWAMNDGVREFYHKCLHRSPIDDRRSKAESLRGLSSSQVCTRAWVRRSDPLPGLQVRSSHRSLLQTDIIRNKVQRRQKYWSGKLTVKGVNKDERDLVNWCVGVPLVRSRCLPLLLANLANHVQDYQTSQPESCGLVQVWERYHSPFQDLFWG